MLTCPDLTSLAEGLGVLYAPCLAEVEDIYYLPKIMTKKLKLFSFTTSLSKYS